MSGAAHDAVRHHVVGAVGADEKQFEKGDPLRDGNQMARQPASVAKQSAPNPRTAAKFPREVERTKQRRILPRNRGNRKPQHRPRRTQPTLHGERGEGAHSPEAVEDADPPARERRAAGDHHEDDEERRRGGEPRPPPGPRRGTARLCHLPPPLERRALSQTACVRARREREGRRGRGVRGWRRRRRRGGRALSAAPIYTSAARRSGLEPPTSRTRIAPPDYQIRKQVPRTGRARTWTQIRETFREGGCMVPPPSSKTCRRAN